MRYTRKTIMLVHLSFRSWCLNINTDVEVILPSIKQGEDAKEYYCSGKKYLWHQLEWCQEKSLPHRPHHRSVRKLWNNIAHQ